MAKTENKMREIKIEKIVLNIGTHGDTANMEKAKSLLSKISNKKVVETINTIVCKIWFSGRTM